MIEIRRPEDDELCGFIESSDDLWHALTVFGGRLQAFDDQESARNHVLANGLPSLAERWWYRESPDCDWQVVCIQEASPESIRLALDYYPGPGVPTITIAPRDLLGPRELRLDPG